MEKAEVYKIEWYWNTKKTNSWIYESENTFRIWLKKRQSNVDRILKNHNGFQVPHIKVFKIISNEGQPHWIQLENIDGEFFTYFQGIRYS